MTTAFEKGKKTTVFPCWRDKRAHLFSIKDFTGALAMFAIRQSPFDYPMDLTQGVAILRDRLKSDFVWKDRDLDFRKFTCDEINDYLRKVTDEEQVFKGWNTPKIDSGKPYQIIDRYSKPDPYHDFIDTGAMSRNIANIMFIEKLHWEEQE